MLNEQEFLDNFTPKDWEVIKPYVRANHLQSECAFSLNKAIDAEESASTVGRCFVDLNDSEKEKTKAWKAVSDRYSAWQCQAILKLNITLNDIRIMEFREHRKGE